jgi:hypothetical protein
MVYNADVSIEETVSTKVVDRTVYIPKSRPIVSVTSVVLDGTTLTDGTDYNVDGNIIRFEYKLYKDWENLVVTYKAGYETIPKWLTLWCTCYAAILILAKMRYGGSENNYWSERKQYEDIMKSIEKAHKRVNIGVY